MVSEFLVEEVWVNYLTPQYHEQLQTNETFKFKWNSRFANYGLVSALGLVIYEILKLIACFIGMSCVNLRVPYKSGYLY